MISYLRGFRASKIGFFLAVLVLGAAPAASQAGWLGFRNDTKNAVIVQTGVPVGALVRWGRPKVLQPGAIAWDAVLQPGLRRVQVFDANQKPLYQDTIRCVGDLYYSVQDDPAGGVKLVPIKTLKPPQGRGR
jgi:hypothetical protein